MTTQIARRTRQQHKQPQQRIYNCSDTATEICARVKLAGANGKWWRFGCCGWCNRWYIYICTDRTCVMRALMGSLVARMLAFGCFGVASAVRIFHQRFPYYIHTYYIHTYCVLCKRCMYRTKRFRIQKRSHVELFTRMRLGWRMGVRVAHVYNAFQYIACGRAMTPIAHT